MALACACGKYTVIGLYGGATVGAGIGAVAHDEDRAEGALIGAFSVALLGLLVGGVIDLINKPVIDPDH